ncbi:hypothetical protein ScPMuIL_017679 [Solemya velum]
MDSPLDDSLHNMEICFQDVENKMERMIVGINLDDQESFDDLEYVHTLRETCVDHESTQRPRKTGFQPANKPPQFRTILTQLVNTYRIISVEGSKAIINSTITPNLTFTKTSQKFGQWSDPRANTVYGLGFSTEADLSKFIEKFKEIKELCKNQTYQTSPVQVNGTSVEENHAPSQTASSPHMNRQFFHHRSSSLTSVQNDQRDPAVNLRERRNSFNTSNANSNSLPPNATEAQLKYENDRLKLALAQSSANAKKWEIELQTLKNNNARLTAALQESTANVEEWKKQLAAYKDESSRMKKKVVDMEKKHGSEQVKSLQLDIQQMSEQLEAMQRENHQKQEEIDRLQQHIQDLTAKESMSVSLQSRISGLQEENNSLSMKVQDFQRLLQDSNMSQDQDKRELLHLQDLLGSKITELYELHEQVVSVIRKESQS